MNAQGEFKDPMKYIASIEAEAGMYGEALWIPKFTGLQALSARFPCI